MNKTKKILAFVLTLALIVTMIPLYQASAATKKTKLNKKKATIYVGKTVKLKVKNNKTKNKVKWSSKNKKVATVNKKGKVKGKKAGKTTIIAKVGKKKYKCKVTVKSNPANNNSTNNNQSNNNQSNNNQVPGGNSGVVTTTKPSSGNNSNQTQAPTTAPQVTQAPTTAPQGGQTTPNTTTPPVTTTPAQTETTKASSGSAIYDNVPYLADGAKGGALNDTYKAVVTTGTDFTVNNIQEFQGLTAIHTILPDANVGNITVNGKASTGKTEGAGLFINLDDLTKTDNEVIVYAPDGSVKGVIRVYNAKGDGTTSGGDTQTTAAQTTAPQGGQQTTTASQGGQQTTTASQGEEKTTSGQSATQPSEATLPDVNGLVHAPAADGSLPHHFAWAPVEGADGYHVYVNDSRVLDVVQPDANLDASLFTVAGTYKIGVQAYEGNAVSKITYIDYNVGGSSGNETTPASTTPASTTQGGQQPTQPTGGQTWVDVPNSDGAYQYNSDHTATEVVNIQKPDWAAEEGIYVSVASGIDNVTVNGVDSGYAPQGAGVVIYLSALTQSVNTVVINHAEGTSTVSIKKNGSTGGDNPTQPQITTPQGGDQTTVPQSSEQTQAPTTGSTDEWIAVEGSEGAYLYNRNHTATEVINVQQPGFAAENGIYIIVAAGIDNVTVNGNNSGYAKDGAGVVVYLSALSQSENTVVINHAEGSSIVKIKKTGGSTGGDNPTQETTKGQEQPITTARDDGTFTTDSSIAKPFGMVVSNPDTGILHVVWGNAGGLNCYNIYVDGVRKKTKVTVGGYQFAVQEGNHTVSVATVNPDTNRESERESMQIYIQGSAEETTDYPENLKPQIDTSIPKEDGKMILQLNNKTNGRWSDDQIYWIVIGKNPQTHELGYVDLDGNLITASTALNDTAVGKGEPANRMYSQKIVHTLAERHFVHLPAIESGRMYLSYGEPVYVTFNVGADGAVGFAGPDTNSASDANNGTLFEYIEFTTEAINGGITFHGNTTRVDFFSFPILTRLTDKYAGFDRCVGDIGTRDEIFNAFRSSVSDPFKGLADDIRINAPAKTLFREGAQYANYFDDYINRFWSKYSNEDLVFACEGGEFRGRVQGDRMRFTRTGSDMEYWVDKPSTQDVLEGRGAFNRPSSDDGQRTSTELVIQAQLCAAFTRGIAMQPENWGKPSTYYKSGEICNEYAKFFHEHSVSGRSYGFCYDDVNDQSTLVECGNAANWTIDLGW